MKAIQFLKNNSDDGSATDTEIPRPDASGRDILVQVEAIAMNPVDYKVRPTEGDNPKILGFDAAGTVVEAGEDVSLFEVGDQVYYAGDVTRPGTNAEFQLVDERIVAKRPITLDAAASAATAADGVRLAVIRPLGAGPPHFAGGVNGRWRASRRCSHSQHGPEQGIRRGGIQAGSVCRCEPRSRTGML